MNANEVGQMQVGLRRDASLRSLRSRRCRDRSAQPRQQAARVTLTNLDLEGTASAYSADVANTDKFYVYYCSRDCAGLTPCREIPESDVPIGGFLRLTERNYVRPGPARAPDAFLLLTPSVIVLSSSGTP